jgi:hypothetical protein
MAGTHPNPHTRADRRLKENKGLPPYSVSDRPWSSISAASYADAVDYANSCLVNDNTGPQPGWVKSQAKLPVREPASMGGKLNRNACHSAAAVLAGGMGGVALNQEEKRRAAQLLLRYYRHWLKETPPDSLKRLAQG